MAKMNTTTNTIRFANEYAENPAFLANEGVTEPTQEDDKKKGGSLQLQSTMDNSASDATHSSSVDVAGVTISTPRSSQQKYAIFDSAKASPVMERVSFFIRSRTGTAQDTIMFVGTCLFVIAFCVVLILYLAARPAPTDPSALVSNYCTTPTCLFQAGTMVRYLNTSVDPCTNFYKFACGYWAAYNPVPPDRMESTVTKRNQDSVSNKLLDLLDAPIQNNYPSSFERKIKHFYQSCADTYNLMKLAAKPFINKVITPSGGWTLFKNCSLDTWNFNQTLKLIHVDFWADAFFFWNVEENPYKPGQNEITLDLGGLSLPWTYYIRPRFNYTMGVLRGYIGRVTEMLIRDAGVQYASDQEKNQSISTFIEDVMAVETQLAISLNRSAPTDDSFATDKQMTLAQLNQAAPAIDWCAIVSAAFAESGVTCDTYVIVHELQHFTDVSKYIQDLGAQDSQRQRRMLHSYLMWRLIIAFADDISYDYLHASMEFYRLVRNAKEVSISVMCYQYTKTMMPDAVSALFVRDHSSDRARAAVHDLVASLKQSISKRAIGQSSWMDEQTKSFARMKLTTMSELLAYPQKLMDNSFMDYLYSKLEITRKDYFQNVLNFHTYFMSYYNQLYNAGSMGTDRGPLVEWHDHYPYDTNIWMYAEDNELLVPAGIMQQPFYNRRYPKYTAYGSMGSMIASKMLQTVDSNGARWFNGTFVNWYSNDTRTRFNDIRSCVRRYLTNTTAGPYTFMGEGRYVNLNAAVMTREVINQVGGIRQSFYAYKDAVQQAPAANDKPLPGMNMTMDQLFFLSYAQTQCFNRNDIVSYVRARLGFSWWPEDVKLSKVFAQIPEFNAAFNCPANAAMNSNNKCPGW